MYPNLDIKLFCRFLLANDDATKSIEIILSYVSESIKKGLNTRENEKLENEAKKEKGDEASSKEIKKD